jgi:hypothetical protein
VAFNLYFAGSQAKVADEVIEENNLLRLLSYLNDKRHIFNREAKGLKTFVDSGAYSAHTKGAEIDVDDYIAFLNEHDETVSICAQLDKIPGEFNKPKTKEQLLEAPELSWENYLYMYPKMKSPEKLLPIFHQGEDFKHLERILNHEPKVQYMGISPANDLPTKVKEVWINECFKIIKKSKNPDIKTHAFGMTSLWVLNRYPFTSADSTSWIMTGANGGIMSEYGVLMVSDNGKKNPKHVMNLPKPVLEELKNHVESKGFTLEELGSDYKQRMVWNILFLKEWADNYKYQPVNVGQAKLF